MKKICINFIVFTLLVLLLPYIITVLLAATGNILNIKDSSESYNASDLYDSYDASDLYDSYDIYSDDRMVLLNYNNVEETLNYFDYLTGMTARMMISFDDAAMQYDELIKLCCVISNTFINNKFFGQDVISGDFLSDYYIGRNELMVYWGENYNDFYNALLENVISVHNNVIVYNADIISPFYHLISSGMTRAFEESDLYPYLKSVNTNKDLEESAFLAVSRYTFDEFTALINEYYDTNVFDTNNADIKDKIQITKRDSSGYVESLMISDISVSGDEFAEIFSLNSPSFTITYQDDSIKIITKGIGHGYGISLSYALRMIMEGADFRDVIQYFYDGVDITAFGC